MGLTLIACGGGDTAVLVGAGTTVVDSGLIEGLVSVYESEHPGVEVSVLGESSATILELARQGALDLTITHAPVLEEAFFADGTAQAHQRVFESSFVVLGPPDLVALIEGLSVRAVFATIQDRGWTFVSRADGSGTHSAELELWNEDVTSEAWYLATGQGMGLTMLVADQREAFTLAEAGAYFFASDSLTLVPVGTSDSVPNPYTASLISGSNRAGSQFYDWLVGDQGRAALSEINERLFGSQVYRSSG